MKFIHTADLHLDSPFLGLKHVPEDLMDQIYHSTFKSFEQIINDAISLNVDFICIAGDIFDRDEHSMAAENFFVSQCERLNKKNIPVYLCYGNHDYQNVESNHVLMPDNVHVFKNSVETKTLTTRSGEKVAISGFSYASRWINSDEVVDYPLHSSMSDWHIGMLHGAIASGTAKQDNYAPFSLDELKSKRYDYWALGHIHKRQILNDTPPIVYSGNTQGRHKNETGEKGYYLVTSSGRQLVPEFHAVSTINWQTISIKLLKHETINEFLTRFESVVSDTIDNQDIPTLVSVSITSINNESESFRVQLANGAILARMQMMAKNRNYHYWPFEIRLPKTDEIPQISGIDQHFWLNASDEVFQIKAIAELADKLFSQDFIEKKFNNENAVSLLKNKSVSYIDETVRKGHRHED
ncbi:DNA repair exonuclease [Paucilactobacillus suebicus]|uniref:Metallophosphoesterase n=1 Tax=Paucilactobacillus suebicus DSM 5007 = KCTC 3549 TaxID=1423807 RepID=A0A0R1W511_9LACO|nr:DNA repair exonuclease [Paucilactobacillus suebicus]KRM12743.1 metallophosphoesterase [Paucilactobacillus suebicus DSM 5007 = KCTC 3549]